MPTSLETSDRAAVEARLGFRLDERTWELWQTDPDHRARLLRNTAPRRPAHTSTVLPSSTAVEHRPPEFWNTAGHVAAFLAHQRGETKLAQSAVRNDRDPNRGRVSTAEYHLRLAACSGCPHRRADRCTKCKCENETHLHHQLTRSRWRCRAGAFVQPRTDWRMKFACGITTAPRQDPTLVRSAASFRLAGWEPTIFAEPETDLSMVEDLYPVVQRPERFGCWHNWFRMLQDLLLRHPDAEAVLTVQDDTLVCRGSRAIVEKHLAGGWPEDCGLVSLYTPRHYSLDVAVLDGDGNQVSRHGNLKRAKNKAAKNADKGWTAKYVPKPAGLRRVHTRSLWGACALIFPRHVAEAIVEHPVAVEWNGARRGKRKSESREDYQAYTERWNRRPPWKVANSDSAIGKILNRLGLSTYWYTNPSLAQHVAEHSAIGHGGCKGNRAAHDWPGELFDVSENDPYA